MIKSKGKIFTLAAAFALTAALAAGVFAPPPRKRRSFPFIRRNLPPKRRSTRTFSRATSTRWEIPPWRNRSVRKTVTGF